MGPPGKAAGKGKAQSASGFEVAARRGSFGRALRVASPGEDEEAALPAALGCHSSVSAWRSRGAGIT